MTRHLLEHLADGAKILNLSTGKALTAGANSASYHVSKAGMHMLTECLANELWPRNIDVNNLIPGPTATTTFTREDPANRSTPEQLLAQYQDELPAGLPKWERVKHPEEVAELAYWVVSKPVGGRRGRRFRMRDGLYRGLAHGLRSAQRSISGHPMLTFYSRADFAARIFLSNGSN